MEGSTEQVERTRRRRRTPQEAEAEIVAAAEVLLRERPFRDLTVDEVMRRTELSRPSFYVYFRDRHHLVLRVVEGMRDDLMAMSDSWLSGGGDGPTEIRAAHQRIAHAFDKYGPILKALADAAADDPRVEEVYAALVNTFVDATAEHIEREQQLGRTLPIDPQETAKALIWMQERYLLETFGRGKPTVPPDQVAELLSTIVTRVVYGPDA